MPPTAKQPIRRPAIDAPRLADLVEQDGDVRKQPLDEDGFKEHRAEADLGARIGEYALEVGDDRGAAERRRRREFRVAERPEGQNGDSERKRAEDREDAAPAEQIADHASDRGAKHIGGERDAEEPRDGDLTLVHRHEIAQQSHRHRKYAARHEPGHDPHGDQQREVGRNRAYQRRYRHHQHAGVHQPGLAEEIAGDAQHGWISA